MASAFNMVGLGQARAMILHPPHDRLAALERQLKAIGLEVERAWPELPAAAISADFVFYDTDKGHDAQFPWAPGAAPMPMIALVGSEAPGRIEWASRMGADALLLKPLGSGGAFSALLMARQAFELRRSLGAEIDQLRHRLAARQTVVQAVALLEGGQPSRTDGYDRLRHLSMAWRVSMEEAAQRIVANPRTAKGPVRDCN